MSAAFSGGALEERELCVAEVSRHAGAYCNSEGLRHLDPSSEVSNSTKPLKPKGEISYLLRGPPTCQGMSYQNGTKVLWGETQARGILIAAKSPWNPVYGVCVSLSPPHITGLAAGTVYRSCFSPRTLSIYGSKKQVPALELYHIFHSVGLDLPPAVLAVAGSWAAPDTHSRMPIDLCTDLCCLIWP